MQAQVDRAVIAGVLFSHDMAVQTLVYVAVRPVLLGLGVLPLVDAQGPKGQGRPVVNE